MMQAETQSQIKLHESLKRAAGLGFTGDNYRDGAFMYSLGQLLGERAELARNIISSRYSKDQYENALELYNQYNLQLKQYLGILE